MTHSEILNNSIYGQGERIFNLAAAPKIYSSIKKYSEAMNCPLW